MAYLARLKEDGSIRSMILGDEPMTFGIDPETGENHDNLYDFTEIDDRIVLSLKKDPRFNIESPPESGIFLFFPNLVTEEALSEALEAHAIPDYAGFVSTLLETNEEGESPLDRLLDAVPKQNLRVRIEIAFIALGTNHDLASPIVIKLFNRAIGLIPSEDIANYSDEFSTLQSLIAQYHIPVTFDLVNGLQRV